MAGGQIVTAQSLGHAAQSPERVLQPAKERLKGFAEEEDFARGDFIELTLEGLDQGIAEGRWSWLTAGLDRRVSA